MLFEAVATPDVSGQRMLQRAKHNMHLAARGYQQVQRVARVLADLTGAEPVARIQCGRVAQRPPLGAVWLRRHPSRCIDLVSS